MEQPERTTVARETDRIQQATASDARRRALAAGCVGNLVEWYDFALYGAFATLLAAAFFPGADPASGLLATSRSSGWPSWPARSAPCSLPTTATGRAAGVRWRPPSCSWR